MSVITVSQLNNYMKRYVDNNKYLSDLWIKGEVSNFKKHYSGHLYMTLKDETSSMKAVMFKFNADKLRFIPENGSKIIAFGKISVYEKDGTYQLYIENIIPDGVGELYAAYEKLKFWLQSEGYFDESKKKRIPLYPKAIGIITSVSGAALRDIMNVISRRYTLCDIHIYPVKVQGVGAAESICEALEYFSDTKICDVLILSRGGGSIEDLWAFNEEKTAMSIYNCKIPVICGVGHETDFTISDFVADLRAPTPSAAAEIATPSQKELKNQIIDYKNYFQIFIKNYINTYRAILRSNSSDVLNVEILSIIEKNSLISDSLKIKLINSFLSFNTQITKKLSLISASLDSMNPKKVLKRGYVIITDTNDNFIESSTLKNGESIKLVFDKGSARCVVTEVNYE